VGGKRPAGTKREICRERRGNKEKQKETMKMNRANVPRKRREGKPSFNFQKSSKRRKRSEPTKHASKSKERKRGHVKWNKTKASAKHKQKWAHHLPHFSPETHQSLQPSLPCAGSQLSNPSVISRDPWVRMFHASARAPSMGRLGLEEGRVRLKVRREWFNER
jgi:hypothetical protein